MLGRVIDHALAIEILGEHVGDHENGVRGFAVHGLEHPVEVVGRAPLVRQLAGVFIFGCSRLGMQSQPRCITIDEDVPMPAVSSVA